MEIDICNEWGYDVYFDLFIFQFRGKVIFINNNFEYKVYNIVNDNFGNFFVFDIELSNICVSLVVIYGFNEDNFGFYNMVLEVINNFKNDNIILVGDFNFVLNLDKDYYNYKYINNVKVRDKLLEINFYYNLLDIFREFYFEKLRYIWCKFCLFKQVCLDFFLVLNFLLNMV